MTNYFEHSELCIRETRLAVWSGESRAMFTRICVETASKLHIEKRIVNNYVTYKVFGFLSEVYNIQFDFFDSLFRNRSYHVTENALECIDRLVKNESDFSTVHLSNHDPVEGLKVPLPYIPIKTTMLTGYVHKKLSPNDFDTVLGNFKLIDAVVYLTVVALVGQLAVYVNIRMLVHWAHRRGIAKIRPIAWIHTTRTAYTPLSVMQFQRKVVRQLRYIFHFKSKYFRSISFLLSLLCFFMASGFAAVYSVSRIVTEQPHVTRTYQMLLKDKRSSAFFYDHVFPVSSEFKYAPPNSVKAKIWSKRAGRGDQVLSYNDPEALQRFKRHTHAAFDSMNTNHSVLIAKSFANIAIKNLYCGSSPENELWRMLVFADDSEKDRLFGWPVSPAVMEDDFIISRFKRLVASGILLPFQEKGLEGPFKVGWLLSGSSVQHRLQQQQVCRDDYSVEKEYNVLHSLSPTYYKSFALLHLSLLSLACFFLVLETALAKWTRPTRR